MDFPHAAPAAVAALCLGLAISACSSDLSTGAAPAPSDAILAQHTPAPQRGAPGPGLLVTGDYTQLDAATASGIAGSLSLSVDAGGTVPRFADAFIASVAVFGYAWVDAETGAGIVAVIHPAIGRDSRQNPDKWHTHPVQLAAGTGGSEFCIVSIGRSQGGIAIRDDVLDVHVSGQWAGISADALDVAAAFIVQGEEACAGTGLGVHVLDAEGL